MPVRLAGKLIFCVTLALLLVSCGGGDGSGDGGTEGTAEELGYEPELVSRGEDLYQQNCATCHGEDLRGTETGPPFLDVIYAPNHHPDEAFQAAAAQGVQPHHWDFGPMPPVPAVDSEDVAAIVAFVRTQQFEAGIERDPSH
jgi:mono/diheme cytochrome c family protein